MELITKKMENTYLNERNEVSSIREDKFNTLEEKLAKTYKKLVELDRLKSTKVAAIVPEIWHGSVKALTQFHEQQQKTLIESHKTSEELIRLRQWLVRQGARLTLDGKIIWSKSGARVLWDTELAQQTATKEQIRGGLLYTGSGKPLDTRFRATHFSGRGLPSMLCRRSKFTCDKSLCWSAPTDVTFYPSAEEFIVKEGLSKVTGEIVASGYEGADEVASDISG